MVPAVSDARFKALVIVGLVVRIGLIAFGLFQDANFAVKYTDVDYEVVSDAAVLMSYGASPFERTTYRYSPLLAALLLPNVWIHKCAGKLLFTAADFLVTVFTRKLVLRALPTSAAAPNAAPLAESETGAGRAPRARRNEQAVANFWALAWWLNPLSANMSSRGNADALVLALILGTVLLLFQRRLLTSALVFGLSVHFRIYPIVYAPALVVFVWLHLTPGTEQRGLTAFWGRRLWRVVQFGLVSGSVFLLLTFGTYSLYGFEGLFESLLYHAVRSDNRHNFSAYFYALYLRMDSQLRWAAFVPQLLLPFVLAVKLVPHSLSLSLYATTVVFVVFNKVCTAQYFLWWAVFLPLVLPRICERAAASNKSCNVLKGGVLLGVLWAACEGHWLYWAYHLEFEGQNTFFQIWIAGLLFVAINVLVLCVVIRAATKPHTPRLTAGANGQHHEQ